MAMRWLAIGLMVAALPAMAAQRVDPLTATTDPADRAVMSDAAAAMRSGELPALEAVLARLPRPTPLRGMVQTYRAMALSNADREADATVAIEEAMRLLPDQPGPKLFAASIFTFSGAPQRAADLWLEASRMDVSLARQSDRYAMAALVGRLRDGGDTARADRVAARMSEIGFASAMPNEQSVNALAVVREAVAAGRYEQATSAVTAIANPDLLRKLYVDRRYERLWPRIAEWAGGDLSGQSSRYLEELRSAWLTADDFTAAAPFARRLGGAQAHPAVVTLFLPMLDRLRPDVDVTGAELLAPIVASSLAKTGRGADAEALLARVAAALPADYGPNALNIDLARSNLATDRADWPTVLQLANGFLKKAGKGGVNASALMLVRASRACALHQLGRKAEAAVDAAIVVLESRSSLGTPLLLYACQNDLAAARALVIRFLDDPANRGDALLFLQTYRDPPETALDRLVKPFQDAVRRSPDVIAAANKVGRILPQPIDLALPPGFDPYRGRPVAGGVGRGDT